ncbi:hypothetical protein PUN28_009072 [Cardiocondyla obscurior]|uniref:Secreted protein n=1 Tax=Cardiocondyla obscurior TaxID=286306 RepID=A0AAW2FSE6_9HYME
MRKCLVRCWLRSTTTRATHVSRNVAVPIIPQVEAAVSQNTWVYFFLTTVKSLLCKKKGSLTKIYGHRLR